MTKTFRNSFQSVDIPPQASVPRQLARTFVYSLRRYSTGMDTRNDVQSTPPGQIHDVPLHVVIRPIPPVLDETKVQSLMTTLQDPSQSESVPPIDILWIKGEEGGHYFYSFGGCHRYEAHKRLNLPTIKGNLIEATRQHLTCYLGASTPILK